MRQFIAIHFLLFRPLAMQMAIIFLVFEILMLNFAVATKMCSETPLDMEHRKQMTYTFSQFI